VGVPSLKISGLPFGTPGTKSHLEVAPVDRCRIYYKGESGGFPQVRAVVSLVSPSCPWLVLAPKVFQLCTNHLVLVLCKSVWVIEACQFFLVPSRSSNTPLYPSKVLQAKERASTLCLSIVLCLGLIIESLKELGARQHATWHNYFSEKHVLCTIVRLIDWEAETKQRQYFYINRYNMIKITFQRPYVILLFLPSLIINSSRLRIQDC
jgi:hypothetical protein